MTSSASRGQSKTRECNSLRKTRFLISQGAGPLLYAAVVLHQEPERQFESTRSPTARDTGIPGKPGFPWTILATAFPSSNPTCPASQLSLCGVVSTGVGTLDIPAG